MYRGPSERAASRLRDQRGLTFIEVMVAVALLGVSGVGIMSALSTGYKAQDINRESVIGENLVRAVLEDIRFQSYLDSYTVSVTVPTGYSYTITTEQFCAPEPCSRISMAPAA